MKVLVLGMGLQGRAVIHDLEACPLVTSVLAADLNPEACAPFLRRIDARKTRTLALDVSDPSRLGELLRTARPDVVVSMLPPALAVGTARVVLDHNLSYVSSNYPRELTDWHDEACERGVTMLPEMGLDPGIDLLLGRLVLDYLDEVEGLRSYGGGVPAPESRDRNPLRYGITWSWQGVLEAYKRPARLVRGGQALVIPGDEMFLADHVHSVDVPGVGVMEAYPNGDALAYQPLYGLPDSMAEMGRYGLRWPGHSAFWRKLVGLGFLDETPISVGKTTLSPRDFLIAHLGPRLQFSDEERDMVVIRVEGWGSRAGRPCRVVAHLVDYRDLETGLFAMNRTVGYTSSIGALMILDGRISARGVLSPARDVPVAAFLSELEARGMTCRLEVSNHD